MAHHRRPVRLESYPIEYLGPNPYQPRRTIDPAELSELVSSIERFGFTGYLEARRDPDHPGRKLQIVFGHRRLAAAEAAGLHLVPVVIVDRTDQEMADQAFIENRTHKQLKPWEEAIFLHAYLAQHRCTFRELGRNLGVSKGYVQNRLDLVKIPEDSPIRPPLERGELDMTTAMTLHKLALELPKAEIAALVDQVLAGTTSNTELTRRKPKATRPSKSSQAPTRTTESASDAGPTPAPPFASAAPSPPVSSEQTPTPNLYGRFADLVLGEDPAEQQIGSDPEAPRMIPCGEDDEALIAAGLLTPDGLDLRLEPVETRAAYLLLHELEHALPDLEALRQQADIDCYPPEARQRWAGVLDRYERLFDDIWTEEA